MNERIAKRITESLLRNTDEEEITYIQLEFYIEILFSEVEKCVLLLGIFGVFGYWKQLLIIYFIAIFIRRYSGGNHCKTFLGCFIFSTIFSYGIIALSKYVHVNNVVSFGIVIVHIVVMACLTPIKSYYRPELNDNDIKKIRKKGIIGIVFVYIVYCYISFEYKNMIIMTLLFLLIDELEAGFSKGFTKIHKRGEDL